MDFQLNKTELQNINEQLKARNAALPTLKNKESALRAVIKKHKKSLEEKIIVRDEKQSRLNSFIALYDEFPADLVEVEKVLVDEQKIAGVKIPILKDIIYKTKNFSLFGAPFWILDGMELLKDLLRANIEVLLEEKSIEVLEYARKKTTQKVNLYEKVQIPEFEMAVLKIKRYLADVENLDRVGQKIVKKRKSAII